MIIVVNIIEYFIFCNASDGLERQHWKNINSGNYELFKEGHIHDVVASLSHDISFIRAKCFLEMKKDRVYKVQLQINANTNSVKVAECTCPVGLQSILKFQGMYQETYPTIPSVR